MKAEFVQDSQKIILDQLSNCLAQLTKLTLRQSLYDLHLKSLSYQDVKKIPSIITNNARNICSCDIYHILTDDDEVCLITKPVGQFSENLYELNRKELQWLVAVQGNTAQTILDANYEINFLSPTAALLDLNPRHSEIVDGLAAAAEFQLIEACMSTNLKI